MEDGRWAVGETWESRKRKADLRDNKTTGQQDHGTTGLRDHRTTGSQDHGTTGPRERRTSGTQGKAEIGTKAEGRMTEIWRSSVVAHFRAPKAAKLTFLCSTSRSRKPAARI